MRKHFALTMFLISMPFFLPAETNLHPALSNLEPIQPQNPFTKTHPFEETKMIPLGFSAEGAYAYGEKYCTGGGCGANLILFDLIRDKVISDVKDREFLQRPGMEQSEESFKELINKAKVSNFLFSWKITALDDPGLRALPATVEGHKVTAWIDQGKVLVKIGSEIRAVADLNDERFRGRQGYGEEKAGEFFIEGFFKSPLEDRIVVIVSCAHLGYEGAPMIEYFPIGVKISPKKK